MTINSYQNLYDKFLYINVPTPQRFKPGVINEIQIRADRFGLTVLTTDGFKYFDNIHCKTPCQAVRIVRAIAKKLGVK